MPVGPTTRLSFSRRDHALVHVRRGHVMIVRTPIGSASAWLSPHCQFSGKRRIVCTRCCVCVCVHGGVGAVMTAERFRVGRRRSHPERGGKSRTRSRSEKAGARARRSSFLAAMCRSTSRGTKRGPTALFLCVGFHVKKKKKKRHAPSR